MKIPHEPILSEADRRIMELTNSHNALHERLSQLEDDCAKWQGIIRTLTNANAKLIEILGKK